MKEADLHKLVADYLDLALVPPTWWTTFPADGASRRGLIGLKLGVPDILIIHEGRAYWIELKVPGGALSAAQKRTFTALFAAGCEALTRRSLDEVIDLLRLWGIPINPAVRITA